MNALPGWAIQGMEASAKTNNRPSVGLVLRRQTFGLMNIEFLRHTVVTGKRHLEIVPINPGTFPTGRYRFTLDPNKQPEGMKVDHLTAVVNTSLRSNVLTFNGTIFIGSLPAQICHGSWNLKQKNGTISL